MLFIFLVGICRPFVIEDQITVLTPSSHTLLAYIKGVQPILDLNVLHIKGLLLLVCNNTPEIVSSYPDVLMITPEIEGRAENETLVLNQIASSIIQETRNGLRVGGGFRCSK
jgi:hypothetical protein